MLADIVFVLIIMVSLLMFVAYTAHACGKSDGETWREQMDEVWGTAYGGWKRLVLWLLLHAVAAFAYLLGFVE